jgi:hypothetical protein
MLLWGLGFTKILAQVHFLGHWKVAAAATADVVTGNCNQPIEKLMHSLQMVPKPSISWQTSNKSRADRYAGTKCSTQVFKTTTTGRERPLLPALPHCLLTPTHCATH